MSKVEIMNMEDLMFAYHEEGYDLTFMLSDGYEHGNLFDLTLLQKWLRETHHIDVWVQKKDYGDITIPYQFVVKYKNKTSFGKRSKTYEDELILGLVEALKYIPKKDENKEV